MKLVSTVITSMPASNILLMRKSIDLVRVYIYMKADTWEQTRHKTFTDSSGSELG
jgi:hypothetical protein